MNISLASSFALLDLSAAVAGLDTLYAADTGAAAGIRKYTFNGTQWSEGARLSLGIPATAACVHVAAKAFGTTVVVLCSADNGTIYRFDDVGGATGPASTTVVAASAGTAFRGIAFVP